MSNIERRIAKLEIVYGPPQCPECWWWAVTPVIVDELGHQSRPMVCPVCGKPDRAPFSVEIGGGVSLEQL
ncbi:MAG: hypothetical protein QM753_08745 [Thermomicrobiales bacterium]